MKKEKTLHLAECPYIGRNKWEKSSKKRPPKAVFFSYVVYASMRLVRYFLTIKATLKVMASSNSRRSRPVSFLIFSRR